MDYHRLKYARRIIKKIRKYDKKNIIIAGSSTWSQDVDQTAKSPLKGKNIAYSLHFYAATHKEDLQQKLKTAYKAGLPILVTEFSICDASGNGAIDKSSGKKWIKLLKKYKIGFIAWSLCNKQESASLLKASCSKTGNFKKSDPLFTPFVSAVILQYLAYYVAEEKGLNVDQPRNLAKSVTVE